MNAPKAYATLLLWLLSELFEELPEVGDPEKPKSVFGGGSSRRQSAGEAMVKSTARAVGSEVGRQIIRGVLGFILGDSGRRR
jgi:hypothetical protein